MAGCRQVEVEQACGSASAPGIKSASMKNVCTEYAGFYTGAGGRGIKTHRKLNIGHPKVFPHLEVAKDVNPDE